MKKILVKLISGYIASILMVISFFSVHLSAHEIDVGPHLNTFSAEYFYALKENFGNNTNGSCTCVAIGMLLSFYDSYLNDKFIPEVYDVSGCFLGDHYGSATSPGINFEESWKENPEYTDYNDYIEDHIDGNLHLKLVQLSRPYWNLDGNDTTNVESVLVPIGHNDILCGINLYDGRSVIYDYFSFCLNKDSSFQDIIDIVTVNVSNYNDDEHKNEENPDNAIRLQMIELIEQGIPVIYSGYILPTGDENPQDNSNASASDITGHAMIAYDYDVEEDAIYFHTGWETNTIISEKSDDFIYNSRTTILWFEIDYQEVSHAHTNNYHNPQSNNESTLCACQIYASHPAHENNHFYFDSYNYEAHFLYCDCGIILNEENHLLSYSYLSSALHTERCNNCNYSYNDYHSYTILNNYSENLHSVSCICGDIKNYLRHSPHVYHPVSDSSHKILCECGALIGEEEHSNFSYVYKNKIAHSCICADCGFIIGTESHSIVQDTGVKGHCTDCGAIVNIGSDIIIKGAEDDLDLPTE
jgi:hypothetical protein